MHQLACMCMHGWSERNWVKEALVRQRLNLEAQAILHQLACMCMHGWSERKWVKKAPSPITSFLTPTPAQFHHRRWIQGKVVKAPLWQQRSKPGTHTFLTSTPAQFHHRRWTQGKGVIMSAIKAGDADLLDIIAGGPRERGSRHHYGCVQSGGRRPS